MKTTNRRREPNFNAGAVKLMHRYMRTANPDMWDGMNGDIPSTFYTHPIDYYIDDGHTIRIYPEYRSSNSTWFVVVEYVVCGMVSARTRERLHDVVKDQHLLTQAIANIWDRQILWLEKFDKETRLLIHHFRPVPVCGSIRYKQVNVVMDCSNIAKLAHSILSTKCEPGYDNLNNELLDVWFSGGDIDLYIALAVNSISDASCLMHPNIREWANEYASGMTFDTYLDSKI